MAAVKFLLGLVILVFMVTFAIQNMEPQVTISYYFGYSIGPVPFFFALLAAAVLGMIVAAAYSVVEQVKLSSALRRQKKQIQSLEKELFEYHQRPPEPLKEIDPDETAPVTTKEPGNQLTP